MRQRLPQRVVSAGVFGFIVFASASASAAACVRIMENTVGQLVENMVQQSPDSGRTPPEPSQSLKTGQIFPSPSSDARFVQVLIGRDIYRVSKVAARAIKLKSCLVQPICLVANTDSAALKNIDLPPEEPGNGSSFKAGQMFGAIAMKVSSQRERFFLVPYEDDYYWVRGRDTAMNINKTCSDVAGTEVLVNNDPRAGKYAFGFEAGSGSGYKSDFYDAFVVAVPDPSNVGQLPDPIITGVEKGKGLYLGPLMEMRFSDNFKLKLGAQYQENKFIYKGKQNPTIAPNSLDSLPDMEGTIKNQALVFSAVPALEFGGHNHRVGLGISIRTSYYISKPASITYRVGTVFKGNEVVTEAGPKGFESLFLGNLYYQWFPGDQSPFALRLTGETDGKVMQIGLSAFY